MNTIDFDIDSVGLVSSEFRKRDIIRFYDAAEYIKALPYRRNKDKNNLVNVFTDNCGTCSTKHALLKMLADENDQTEFKLILGVFKMNSINIPSVRKVLESYKMVYIPEAHNYLCYRGTILDFTVLKPMNFVNDLLEETEINPDQITDFKVNYHKNFLHQWLIKEQLTYSIEEIWNIREECISAMSSIY